MTGRSRKTRLPGTGVPAWGRAEGPPACVGKDPRGQWTLTGPLMVPEARRSPGRRLQPLTEWCVICCSIVQYMYCRRGTQTWGPAALGLLPGFPTRLPQVPYSRDTLSSCTAAQGPSQPCPHPTCPERPTTLLRPSVHSHSLHNTLPCKYPWSSSQQRPLTWRTSLSHLRPWSPKGGQAAGRRAGLWAQWARKHARPHLVRP